MFKGLTKKAEEEVGNFKTGKSKLSVGDKVSLYGVKGTVKGITGENSDNIYGEPVIEFESEDGKTKQVPEHYLVKVGNKAIVLKDGNVWVVLYANETKSQEFESEAEAREFAKKVGNSYTPNPELIKILEAWLHNRMSEQEARSKIMKITGDKNITDMMIHSPGGFIQAGNKKTGNESIGDEYNAEINRLEKKKMDLERMGQGQKAREIEKQIQQLQKELREYDIGNKKIGNTAHSEKVEVIKRLLAGGWSVEDIYSQLKTEGYEVEKGFIEKLKTGNARPKEQLLADVRELTKYIKDNPDKVCEKEKRLLGEAKEELDKNYGILVNNLKRARNAIKTKNADITLWNGNDSAYIKEDGHVQYLENNSFVVDEDKYDSQEQAVEELTKKGYRKK